tara:strand:+ start:376 stop:1107 length:732 start_codon:yes stop_codon:yes gene_type:complete
MALLAERLKSLTGIQNLEELEQDTIIEDNDGNTAPGLVTSWFDSAAKDVINVLPPQTLYVMGESEILIAPGLGGPSETFTSVPQSRILSVFRKDGVSGVIHECREIDASKKGYAIANDYMYSATKESPIFYRENGKIFVKPEIGTIDADIVEIIYVKYPEVLPFNLGFIRKFPDEIENLVVLKASVYGKFYQIGLANTEEDLEVAASHTNHMSALNQEYTMCLQNYLSGYQLNAKEQGVVNDS